jgi:hypothetical protein
MECPGRIVSDVLPNVIDERQRARQTLMMSGSPMFGAKMAVG